MGYVLIFKKYFLNLHSSRISTINMSDVEGDDVPMAVAADAGSMDINTAIQEVLKAALINNGLARGLHETTKSLDKRQALCQEHQIPLIKVDSNMKLGEWAGLCKLDKDGKARKVVKCSSCVVRDWGKESPALDMVKDYIKSQKS